MKLNCDKVFLRKCFNSTVQMDNFHIVSILLNIYILYCDRLRVLEWIPEGIKRQERYVVLIITNRNIEIMFTK